MSSVHQVKTILILLLMASAPWMAKAEMHSTSPIKKFTRTLSKESRKQVNKIGLGRVPLSIGRLFVEKEFRPALRGIKKVRILHIENTSSLPERKVERLLKNIDHKHFEPLVIVNDGGTKIQLLFKETGKKKKELILLEKDGLEINVIELKVKLNAEQIVALFSKENTIEFLPEF